MYKINVTIKEEDGEKIEGNVIFDSLDKLKHNRDLDILLSLIYKTLVDENNNIDLVKMEIFYVHKCGHYEHILTFNDVTVLVSIFSGLDYGQKLSTHQDKERLEKHYENDFKKRLKFLDLDRDLIFEFQPND